MLTGDPFDGPRSQCSLMPYSLDLRTYHQIEESRASEDYNICEALACSHPQASRSIAAPPGSQTIAQVMMARGCDSMLQWDRAC